MHGGGHEVCPVTAIKDAHRRPAETYPVRAETPRNHSAPPPSSDDLERIHEMGRARGSKVGRPIGVAGSHPGSARDMPVL